MTGIQLPAGLCTPQVFICDSNMLAGCIRLLLFVALHQENLRTKLEYFSNVIIAPGNLIFVFVRLFFVRSMRLEIF
jgi:hypothetical protein